MKLTVRLYAALREAAGKARIDATGATLPEILSDLVEQGGPDLRARILDANGNVRPEIQLLLRMTYLDPAGLDRVQFDDGDTLHVMPPIAGG